MMTTTSQVRIQRQPRPSDCSPPGSLAPALSSGALHRHPAFAASSAASRPLSASPSPNNPPLHRLCALLHRTATAALSRGCLQAHAGFLSDLYAPRDLYDPFEGLFSPTPWMFPHPIGHNPPCAHRSPCGASSLHYPQLLLHSNPPATLPALRAVPWSPPPPRRSFAGRQEEGQAETGAEEEARKAAAAHRDRVRGGDGAGSEAACMRTCPPMPFLRLCLLCWRRKCNDEAAPLLPVVRRSTGTVRSLGWHWSAFFAAKPLREGVAEGRDFCRGMQRGRVVAGEGLLGKLMGLHFATA